MALSENRILVLDDQPALAQLIANIAAACGYESRQAHEPASFFQLYDEWDPTHVVIDLQMPDIDGIAMLGLLAERDCRAKVLIASGMNGRFIDSAQHLGLQRGLDMAGTLQKPFRAAELRELLDGLRSDADWCSAANLAAAIERGELCLMYQPKVVFGSRRITGYEALVRWRHPSRGLVTPDQFVPLAEASGLIDRLTEEVVTQALRQMNDWGSTVEGRVAINLSGRSLGDATFPDRVIEWCAAAGVAPDRLQFELTEASAASDAVGAMEVLSRLNLKGIRLTLDDFGSGYSSVTGLVRLPLSEIKIDKTVVQGSPSSREARVVVRSLVDLARSLDLHVVAAGVESAAIEQAVAELGCLEMQGYKIARPLSPEAVPDWTARWQRQRPEEDLRAVALVSPATSSPLWNKPYDGSEELRLALDELLAERMNPLWDLGRNSLVGWQVVAGGIEVLIVPYRHIVEHFGEAHRLLRGRRLMGNRTFDTVREVAGCTAVHIDLPFSVGDEPNAVPLDVIEQMLRRYGITETLHRGVGLFDIVAFSRFEPSRQIAQLNSLECSINTAQKLMEQIGRPVDLARTTTGDGFYMWNRHKGPLADVDTYLLTLLTLADNALARRESTEFVPELRTCFAIGPHYSYHQTERLGPRGHDYIVGDVTISLARMASKCLPGQILISDFDRPAERGGEPTGPIDFLMRADAAFAHLDGVSLQGRPIGEMRCYLTGTESSPSAFDIARYTIRDKHGYEHAVFNQKLNVYLRHSHAGSTASDVVYLGKRQADLAAFDAELSLKRLMPNLAGS